MFLVFFYFVEKNQPWLWPEPALGRDVVSAVGYLLPFTLASIYKYKVI